MNAAPALLFDIDGTLLDVRRKYWAAHSFLAASLGEDPGAESLFWGQKRQRAPLSELLPGWRRESIAAYGRRWPETIESPEFTSLDSAFAAGIGGLRELQPAFQLVGISMRRTSGPLHTSLREEGILPMLDGLVVLGDMDYQSGVTKTALLQSSSFAALDYVLVVGDSDDDVDLARSLDAVAAIVLTGLRSRRYIRNLQPDRILTSLSELPGILRDESRSLRPASDGDRQSLAIRVAG